MRWLWYFIIYSFCGFLLEVAFARLTGDPKQDRKCRLLLPLCPVYGLGACLILLFAPPARGPLWVMTAGGLAATAAELAMGLFYRFGLGVEFWDYTGMRGSVEGLICPAFSAVKTDSDRMAALRLFYHIRQYGTTEKPYKVKKFLA